MPSILQNISSKKKQTKKKSTTIILDLCLQKKVNFDVQYWGTFFFREASKVPILAENWVKGFYVVFVTRILPLLLQQGFYLYFCNNAFTFTFFTKGFTFTLFVWFSFIFSLNLARDSFLVFQKKFRIVPINVKNK